MRRPRVGSVFCCWALVAQACSPENGQNGRRQGATDSAGDSAFLPADTGSDAGGDYDDPVPTGDFACYLGPVGLGDTCLPVVRWDPEWGSDYRYPEPLDSQYTAPSAFLDLEGGPAGADLAVAPTFVLSEFVSARKGRFAVLQPHLVEHLQAVRDGIGGPVVINSGYRSPGYNAGIDGAAEWSRHLYGDAVDISSPEAGLDALADQCEDQGAAYVAVYTSHVHCDWRDHPLDPAFFAPTPTPRTPARSAHITVLRRAGRLVAKVESGLSEGTPRTRWQAWDQHGVRISTGTGPAWTPPPGAHRYSVDVGRQAHHQGSLHGRW